MKDLGYFRDLLTVLVDKELRLRYHGTALGILWSLANPIAFALVLWIAFKRVFQIQIENYSLFILAGLFPWQAFSNSMNAAANLFIANSPLIKKLRFPTYSLCAAVVVTDMIHFLVTIPVIAGIRMLSTGDGPPVVWIIGVPLLLVIHAVTTFGCVLVISSVNALFRDLEPMVRVLLLLLFYVTPILFPESMVPDSFQWLLMAGTVSPFMGLAALYAVGIVCLALPVYQRIHWRLAEVI